LYQIVKGNYKNGRKIIGKVLEDVVFHAFPFFGLKDNIALLTRDLLIEDQYSFRGGK
jgi:hypothetical protein